MRDAVGSTWVFSICLTFIVLFTAYLTISINYARAFRIKTHVISMIEENEGYTDGKNALLAQEISDYLFNQGTDATKVCESSYTDKDGTDWIFIDGINYSDSASSKSHVCIYKHNSTKNTPSICTSRSYYKVVTFFKFDVPVINAFTTFEVSGNTDLILDFASGSCSI